jgi:hypothetical protein
MLFRKILIAVIIVSGMLNLSGCKKGAGNTDEAAAILTGSPTWYINEIAVNDAVTFKDGKMTQQFGGIDFERYMETVQIKKDGSFTGMFKGDTKPFTLKWKTNEKDISVGAVDESVKGGEWTIAPEDVQDGSFIMKTQSTAYDYPRMTKIALKFTSKK